MQGSFFYRSFVFAMFFIMLLTSCQKDGHNSAIFSVKMEALKIPASFDWKTAREVGFSITNLPFGVLRISSADGSQLFYKGYYIGTPSAFQISLSLPTTVNEVLINDQLVTIPANKFLNYTMSGLKDLDVSHTSMPFMPANVTIEAPSAVIAISNNKVLKDVWMKLSATDTDPDADGVIDKYDDYPNDPTRAFNNYFPAEGAGSLAFEDVWPSKGDYDFNDLVVDYQFKTVTNNRNRISEIVATFIVRAAGTSLENGFGFQLPMLIPDADINVMGSSINHSVVSLNSNGTEAGQARTTIIVFDDVFDLMKKQSMGVGFNTTPGAQYVTPDTLRITMKFRPDTYSALDIGLEKFNPFLIINKSRGREVHLTDYPPTSLADLSLFGTEDDNSNVQSTRYYKTKGNLPWAINIYKSYSYSNETVPIVNGYRYFSTWAQSGGITNPDWYINNAGYRNTESLYKH